MFGDELSGDDEDDSDYGISNDRSEGIVGVKMIACRPNIGEWTSNVVIECTV